MPEIRDPFPREWVEFTDTKSKIIYKCDLTWLTSNWQCIYGAGCKGIDKNNEYEGCCSDGAYYTDSQDEKRVKKAAQNLTPNLWQNFALARINGQLDVSEIGLDEERKTKKIAGKCIFLNSPDFSTGAGCAFHYLNQEQGTTSIETKPNVCWQLPIRRTFESRKENGVIKDVVVISEFSRSAWGAGGEEFSWYCTSNSEAHVARQPVYVSCKAELIEMMSETAYKQLVLFCEERVKTKNKLKFFTGKKLLPLFVMHPASTVN